jgi:hypothetical protein
MNKQDAGRKGGLATVERYGSDHMAEIGLRGATSLWKRCFLMKLGTSNWALVEKGTNHIVSTFYCVKDNE